MVLALLETGWVCVEGLFQNAASCECGFVHLVRFLLSQSSDCKSHILACPRLVPFLDPILVAVVTPAALLLLPLLIV